MSLLSKDRFCDLCQTEWVAASLILNCTNNGAYLNCSGKNRPCILLAKNFHHPFHHHGPAYSVAQETCVAYSACQRTPSMWGRHIQYISKWMWKLIHPLVKSKRLSFKTQEMENLNISELGNFPQPTSAQEELFFTQKKKKVIKHSAKAGKTYYTETNLEVLNCFQGYQSPLLCQNKTFPKHILWKTNLRTIS